MIDTLHDIEDTTWFHFLDPHGQELVVQTKKLYERELRLRTAFEDYGFVIFPMAKAYEGFLKKYLYAMKILPESQYMHRQFRIGRSLNPDVSFRHQDELWLYDDVEQVCGKQAARALWQAWIDCRNHIFHYFADMDRVTTLDEVGQRIGQLMRAMDGALMCMQEQK